MKKFSFLLMGAFVIAVASAFTATKPVIQTTAYGYTGTEWKQVNVEDVNVTYKCNAGSSYCLYQDPSFANPLPGQTPNKVFVSLR
ncbi:DUF6520 family protein [Asinibacterium sp. OR53]|uniref:DUF6520 family protein n=1 Tax=Asinibacterium sp. OR53 TaxID=925409 RepID=UPI000479AA16|nr:DUF6520 family protein [Asinibacterium sp. OR53]